MYINIILKFRSLFGLLLTIILFASCSEDIKPTLPTYTELLTGKTSKTWKMVSFTLITRQDNQKYMLLPDRYGEVNSCSDSIDYNDNYYTFYNNTARTMEITEGPEKCREWVHDDYRLVDYWALENASATLTFVFLPFVDYARVPFIIKDLSDRRLTIEYYGDKYIFQYTLNPVKE